jgi:hypothetical protein
VHLVCPVLAARLARPGDVPNRVVAIIAVPFDRDCGWRRARFGVGGYHAAGETVESSGESLSGELRLPVEDDRLHPPRSQPFQVYS